MNNKFKNKLHDLGIYLLNNEMNDSFFRLLKMSQQMDSGLMPGLSLIENSTLLKRLIYPKNQKKHNKWINDFLDINSDIFSKYTPIKRLGGGVDGEAFLTDDGRVFKIFYKPGLMKYYRQESDRLYDGTAIQETLMVYDFAKFRLPDSDGTDFLGWVIMEYAPNPERIGEDQFYVDVRNFIRFTVDLDKIRELSADSLRSMAKKIWAEFREFYPENETSSNPYKYNVHKDSEHIIKYIMSVVYSYIHERFDLHADNMGYRMDTPIFFDAYHPRFDDYDSLDEVKDWDKDAQIALLGEFLKTGQMRQNFDYNDADNNQNTSKEYTLEDMTPKQLDLGRYGDLFSPGSKIREFVNDVFTTMNEERDFSAKQDWVDRFLDQNSEVLSRYDLTKYLGSGAYADAWETDDGRVIKIIRDDKDLSFYKEQQNALHSGEGSERDIMVYDMGTFDVPWAKVPYDIRRLRRMSWVVMEKLNPIRDFVQDYTSQLKNLAEFLKDKDSEITIDSDILFKFKNAFSAMRLAVEREVELLKANALINKSNDAKLNFAKNIEKRFIASDEYRKEIYPAFKDIEQRIGLPTNWSSNILYSMVFHLLQGDDDLHSGNVGFRNNQPVYYDPSNRMPDPIERNPGYTPTYSLENNSKSDSTIILNDNGYIEDETIDMEHF